MRGVWASGLLLAGCGAKAPSRPALPRANGVWVWHEPVGLTPDDRAALPRLGITEVYGLAGTFSSDGERLVLRLRRTYARSDLPLHLVYRFDAGGVRHALDDPGSAAGAIARAFAEDRAKARGAGWRVVGCQLDLDAPTRRLPEYAALLRSLRPRLRTRLSITGLATWLDGGVAEPLRSVDFWCPQLYEFEAPRTLGSSPLSSAGELARLRPRLDALGVPYRVGLGLHGQALVYAGGRLKGTARGLSPSQASRLYPPDPSVTGDAGEERAGFRVDGGTLVFRRPNPRALVLPNDAGFVLFRARAEDEELSPRLATLLPIPNGPAFALSRGAAADPFAAIEQGATVARDRTLTLRWTSPADPPLATAGVRVELRFPPGALLGLAPGDLRDLKLTDAEGRPGASLARAAGAVATLPWIPRGRGASLGPVSLRSGILTARVTARTYAGEQARELQW